MQGKGIVKFFLVVMAIVCIMQFIYVLPTRSVEKNADAHAEAMSLAVSEDNRSATKKEARAAFLDSMSSETIFSIPLLKDFSYEELKKRQLNYGLDLSGGMSVVLQVNLRDFIMALSNYSTDKTFEAALNNADKALQSTQSDYVTLFADSFVGNTEGKKLAPIFARNEGLRDVINFETTDSEVVKLIREKANETVDLTFKRLKDRIDRLGVAQPNVTLDAARDIINVELPGIDNPQRARDYISATAKLEFWNVFRAIDPGVMSAFQAADKKLAGGEETTENEAVMVNDTTWTTNFDENGTAVDSSMNITQRPAEVDPFSNSGPLFSNFQPNMAAGGQQLNYSLAVMGTAEKNKMNLIKSTLDKNDKLYKPGYLDRPEIKALFPKDLEFRWAAKPFQDYETKAETKLYELYAIKKTRGKDNAPLEGDRVEDASANPDESGQVAVSLSLDQKGTQIWGDMTTKAAQDNNREIAILLDDRVVSAPRVNDAITGGNSSITGNFSLTEGKDLASILQVGKLPAKTQIIQSQVVGPSLGQKNITRSLRALFIGFGLVLLFMMFYYGGGGVVSILALFLNIFFILAALASFGTVLTLAGIAGIVLTIGMAVDANVIIYERIREELRAGKSTLMAVRDGFDHSYSAIIDANVTSLLTAGVLFYFGLGPIKGFATVLIIGILCSLFTAVLVGRMIIEWWLGRESNTNKELSFWTGASKGWFSNMNIDWLGKRKGAYMASGLIILAGLASFFVRGFDLGIDFEGGYSYNIQFDQNMDQVALRDALTTTFGEAPVVKSVDTDNTFNVVSSYLVADNSEGAQGKFEDALYAGVKAAVGGTLNEAQFKAPDGTGTHITSSSKVGPTIADDIKTSSIWATVFALLLIFLYIFIRFNKWQFSMGAVAALFHDVMIVLSLFSIFHGILPFPMEIDQAFIAAILTVIGYSINDTVVVFDRIREFMGSYVGKSKEEIINLAVNSTISRTLITSLTTLFVVFMLFIFSSGSIKGFAFALLVGILVGTYSSVFIATPVMSDLSGDIDMTPRTVKKSKKKSAFSRASTSTTEK